MKPDQLPLTESFKGQYLDDLKAEYDKLRTQFEAQIDTVVHMRVPDRISRSEAKKIDQYGFSLRPSRFEHFVVLVKLDGTCVSGMTRLDGEDAYRRKVGYRIAAFKALRRMDALQGQVDFAIGAPVPRKRRVLVAMVQARLIENNYKYRNSIS